ncbi:relaxase/mobilization nuclease domain-containing protein [Pontibacter actiniarum]|uniref:MobA/VirD2-like nuclease domain-containing protein n=1 Tax=Pontibacter actiniarum TaxID=323450 RepID=A0A1X9YTD1_9BACT|nr:relaxase/mobilization nuclease domain-containing protein [Pontibacter actiniarum]ARS36145.1 hypothetical protein CA264_12285 [Pontibacter actiniarum]
MIGKAFISKSFARSAQYLVQKPGAQILAADGVRTASCQTIASDFAMMCRFKPGLQRVAGHVSLSWSPLDREKLTPQVMVARAKEYMEKMRIQDTQYLIVEHRDTQHPHIHILYNRVSYQGKVIPDWRQWPHTVKVCTEMRQKYGYHMPQNQYLGDHQRLKGVDKVRFQLHDAIQQVLSQAKSWDELQAGLQRKGITMRCRYAGGTGKVQGLSFKMGNLSWKGSSISPKLSYGNIARKLERNLQLQLTQAKERTSRKRMAHRHKRRSL